MKKHSYNVSGYYEVNCTKKEKHFSIDVEASDEFEAVKLVLGEVVWKESLEGNSVRFDRFHYEVI